jgi:hypothetical protein
MTQTTIVRVKIVSKKHTPEMITEAVGIRCDWCWRCGDTRKHTIITEKDNGWVLHSGLPKTASLDEHMEALLSTVKPAKAKIRHLSLDDIVEVSCVIYSATRPALNFGSSVIRQLAEMGASLDIDLYNIDYDDKGT